MENMNWKINIPGTGYTHTATQNNNNNNKYRKYLLYFGLRMQ